MKKSTVVEALSDIVINLRAANNGCSYDKELVVSELYAFEIRRKSGDEPIS